MKPWKKIDRKLVFDDSPWLTVEHHTIELPNGQIIPNWPGPQQSHSLHETFKTIRKTCSSISILLGVFRFYDLDKLACQK